MTSGKEELKKAFVEMYRLMPLKRIRIVDLIEKCGLSRSTFYFYYDDLNALYLDCENDAVDRSAEGINDVVLYAVGQDLTEYSSVYIKFLEILSGHSDYIYVFINGSENVSFSQSLVQAHTFVLPKSILIFKNRY